jgi:Protein of unknown function (DUF3383).
MSSVSTSRFVNVIPQLIAARGSGFELNGLLLSKNATLPIGNVYRFESLDMVRAYFGNTSDEAIFAQKYFAGFDSATRKPAALLAAYYSLGQEAGWLRSSKGALKLSDFRDMTDAGVTFVIGGLSYVVNGLDFSQANSFSEIAAIMQTGLNAIADAPVSAANASIVFSSQIDEFILTAGASDESGLMGYAISDGVSDSDLSKIFSQESGAVLSVGQSENTTQDAYMDNIKKQTLNWVTFAKLWEYEESEDLGFAVWASTQNSRFAYVEHDRNIDSTNPNVETSFADLIAKQGIKNASANYGGFELVAFVMGTVASINFTLKDGKITLAFKQQGGQEITCDNDDDYDALTGKGYNAYVRDSTANDMFTGYQRGTVSGDYGFMDSLVNHIWINDSLQVSLRNLLARKNSLPYNGIGLNSIHNAIAPVIEQAKYNGVISVGVELDADIISAVVSETGITDIADTLFAQGWYLLARNPGSAARAKRESPILRFYYCDGGSIQKIDLPSTVIR